MCKCLLAALLNCSRSCSKEFKYRLKEQIARSTLLIEWVLELACLVSEVDLAVLHANLCIKFLRFFLPRVLPQF
jgi:hypothetical protein